MNMHPGHYFAWVVLFLLGYWVAKKYPSLFASVPVVGGIFS